MKLRRRWHKEQFWDKILDGKAIKVERREETKTTKLFSWQRFHSTLSNLISRCHKKQSNGRVHKLLHFIIVGDRWITNACTRSFNDQTPTAKTILNINQFNWRLRVYVWLTVHSSTANRKKSERRWRSRNQISASGDNRTNQLMFVWLNHLSRWTHDRRIDWEFQFINYESTFRVSTVHSLCRQKANRDTDEVFDLMLGSTVRENFLVMFSEFIMWCALRYIVLIVIVSCSLWNS